MIVYSKLYEVLRNFASPWPICATGAGSDTVRPTRRWSYVACLSQYDLANRRPRPCSTERGFDLGPVVNIAQCGVEIGRRFDRPESRHHEAGWRAKHCLSCPSATIARL